MVSVKVGGKILIADGEIVCEVTEILEVNEIF
jgi:pyruvate kinase